MLKLFVLTRSCVSDLQIRTARHEFVLQVLRPVRRRHNDSCKPNKMMLIGCMTRVYAARITCDEMSAQHKYTNTFIMKCQKKVLSAAMKKSCVKEACSVCEGILWRRMYTSVTSVSTPVDKSVSHDSLWEERKRVSFIVNFSRFLFLECLWVLFRG